MKNMSSAKLLTLINEAAVLLLTAEPDKFESALVNTMEQVGTSLNIDCIYVWRARERNGTPVYILLHEWLSSNSDKEKTFENIYGSNVIMRMPAWDDKLFSKRGYMSELAKNFSEFIREKLMAANVQSVTAFPVFFHGKYWGFVTFENRHSEELFTKRQASILHSGSLLFANAVERHDNLLQMQEQLRQQQIMSGISKSFISKEPMDVLIRNALAGIGDFMKVARIIIGVFEKNSEVSRPGYYWLSDERYAPNASMKGFSSILRGLFPHKKGIYDEIELVWCDNTREYKGGGFKLFYDHGIKSLISSPIYVDDELWGVLSIEEHEHFRSWSESDVILINMVSGAISNAVARDIIEKDRASALEQAIAASRAKGDFLSNMSHEMRTPMNAIIGMTAIGRSAYSVEKKDYAFTKIDDASKHLLGVINDVLDMSKIEANKLELSISEFNFERMLQKVVNVINFRLDERRQQFHITIDDNIPQSLIGDDQRLAQVVTNLLSNAVKFTQEEGDIYLEARLAPEYKVEDDCVCILISVIDNGIGINEEQRARLFRSFEQADAGTSRKYGGTGLGLAISKRIIELMGGDIWVESELGQGSKFTFAVPLKRGSDTRKCLLAKGVDWSNIRIFAVDDEPEIREYFLYVADRLGISCDVASSGEEAIELLALENNYDIYFLDWKLPGMNGIELSKRVHAKNNRKSIVILFSSIDWSVVEDDARSAGVDKFLPKPLFQSAIVDIINDCLGINGNAGQADKSNEVDFSGHTILLAEDVEINREVAKALLEPTNIVVECAANGAQALRMFEEGGEKYDMIFMDVQMPEMDGYEATRRIRAKNTVYSMDIPIVAMTANVFREDIERCLASGMNAHIGKPIDYDDMISILRKYIRAKA